MPSIIQASIVASEVQARNFQPNNAPNATNTRRDQTAEAEARPSQRASAVTLDLATGTRSDAGATPTDAAQPASIQRVQSGDQTSPQRPLGSGADIGGRATSVEELSGDLSARGVNQQAATEREDASATSPGQPDVLGSFQNAPAFAEANAPGQSEPADTLEAGARAGGGTGPGFGGFDADARTGADLPASGANASTS